MFPIIRFEYYNDVPELLNKYERACDKVNDEFDTNFYVKLDVINKKIYMTSPLEDYFSSYFSNDTLLNEEKIRSCYNSWSIL